MLAIGPSSPISPSKNESDSLIENWLCSLPTAENAEYVVDGSRSSRLSKRLSLRPSILHRLQSLSAFMSRNKTSSSTRDRSASTDLLQVPPRSASGSSLARSYSASEYVDFLPVDCSPVSHATISRFAALKAQNGFAAMEPGTDTWLWERCAIRLFRLNLLIDVKSDFSKQFNGMIDLYDRVTKFRWPKGWNRNVSSSDCSTISPSYPV
jgi:hypothetical protein